MKPDVRVLVLGPARSGTTLVARMLAQLGLNQIGSESSVQEDAAITDSFLHRDAETFQSLIRLRTESMIGPASLKLTVQGDRSSIGDFLVKNLNFDFCLLPFKNPIATALRRQHIHGNSVSQHLTNVLEDQIAMAKLFGKDGRFLSMNIDSIRDNPREGLLSLMEFLEVEIREDAIDSAIQQIFGSDKLEYLRSTKKSEEEFSKIILKGVYADPHFYSSSNR